MFVFSDLGAHVDGFIAAVAHTVAVGSSATTKITGRKADVLLAAHYASEAALRLMKPATEVTIIKQIKIKVDDKFVFAQLLEPCCYKYGSNDC